MAKIFRVKASARGGKTTVKMMAKHNMDTGLQKGKDGNLIPAKFLDTVSVSHGGKVVFEANLNTAISKNPYLAFTFEGGAKGEELTVAWSENTGTTGTETAAIK
jgi:sulfur-oxidizing protein SoxZ